MKKDKGYILIEIAKKLLEKNMSIEINTNAISLALDNELSEKKKQKKYLQTFVRVI